MWLIIYKMKSSLKHYIIKEKLDVYDPNGPICLQSQEADEMENAMSFIKNTKYIYIGTIKYYQDSVNKQDHDTSRIFPSFSEEEVHESIKIQLKYEMNHTIKMGEECVRGDKKIEHISINKLKLNDFNIGEFDMYTVDSYMVKYMIAWCIINVINQLHHLS